MKYLLLVLVASVQFLDRCSKVGFYPSKKEACDRCVQANEVTKNADFKCTCTVGECTTQMEEATNSECGLDSGHRLYYTPPPLFKNEW